MKGFLSHALLWRNMYTFDIFLLLMHYAVRQQWAVAAMPIRQYVLRISFLDLSMFQKLLSTVSSVPLQMHLRIFLNYPAFFNDSFQQNYQCLCRFIATSAAYPTTRYHTWTAQGRSSASSPCCSSYHLTTTRYATATVWERMRRKSWGCSVARERGKHWEEEQLDPYLSPCQQVSVTRLVIHYLFFADQIVLGKFGWISRQLLMQIWLCKHH